MNNKRFAIKSRRRFTTFIAVIMFVAISIFNTAIGINDAAGSTEKKYLRVEVCQGDTLWYIAQTYVDNVDDYNDIREAVYNICDINNIKASDLREGMKLKVPAQL